MSSRTILAFGLIALLGSSTAWAKKHHKQPSDAMTIVEVSAVSITVDVGHDDQQTYRISDSTKTTLNGFPTTPGNLRAGMDVVFTAAADGETLVTLDAKDPPR